MSIRRYSLNLFPSAVPFQNVQITGSIERSSHIITVSYALLGTLSELVLPAPAEMPVRRNSLWEETCFELFLGIRNSSRYWEFNISPAGHWNVYRFEAYRQGMQEEPAITALPLSIERKPDSFQLWLKIGLEYIVPADQALEAAVSVVVKPVTGPMTYWALVHPGPKADFHRRDGFIIGL